MRILLWHGYLLGGTGSNVYTRALAREWSLAGHDVVVLCQERHPERFDLGHASVVRPEIGGILPVFVVDRYEGLEPRKLQDLTRAERDRYVELNARAVRELLPADLVFANHVLPGGAVGTATGAPYAVKAHGSELEYSIRGDRDLASWGREALEGAGAVFVGSAHIREVLEEVVGHVERVHEVPPGVDIEEFRPQAQDEALAELLSESRRDPPNPGQMHERQPDEGNTERLEAFFALDRPTVVYFGKLLLNKGVHVLLEALDGLDARALVVGFGDYRRELEATAPAGTLFTGPLEHRHLVHLLPLADEMLVELRPGGRRLELLEAVRELERLRIQERELLLDRDGEVGPRVEGLAGEADLLVGRELLRVPHAPTLIEGFEKPVGDACPAPARDRGSSRGGAEPAPLLRRQVEDRPQLGSQILDVSRREAREAAVLGRVLLLEAARDLREA